MKTSKAVIQGYAGVAMVDAKHQVVVHAEAFGEAQEHGLLIPMLEATRETFREANARYLFETGVDGYPPTRCFASVIRALPPQSVTNPCPKRIQNDRSGPRTSDPRRISRTVYVLRASGCTATGDTMI
jgi:hypothetical protein